MNCWPSGKYVHLLYMYSILGRGSICFNYCLHSAWHGGDQFVAMLRWYGSPGFFDSGLQLIYIFGLLFLIFLLTIPYRFSMGFRSGEFAGAFGSVGRCQILLKNEISIFKKLVSRRKHEVLQNVLINRCSDAGFQKTQWTRAATNDYFDTRLVGRLFFRIIRLKRLSDYYFFLLIKNTLLHILSNVFQTNLPTEWCTYGTWFIRPYIIIKRKHKYFRNLSKKKLNQKMLLSFIGQITNSNWNNQIVLIPTITKNCLPCLVTACILAAIMYFLTVIGYLKKNTMKCSAFLS